MHLEKDFSELLIQYERAVSEWEEGLTRIETFEELKIKHIKDEVYQKVVKDEDETREIVEALRKENKDMKVKMEFQNEEIKDLQNSIKVKIKV